MFAPVLRRRWHLIGCNVATAPRLSEGERFRPGIAPHVIGRVHVKEIMGVKLFARTLIWKNNCAESSEHDQQLAESAAEFRQVRMAAFPNCLGEKYSCPDR